ncbi:MAG TPA: ATP-binding protein [Candidatus Dormibacteraeota bacterium]|jgi:two-component system phosphate regulon sensor histidine kinase PhoR|nr:ATP-binding protein [Candidatus Dormibacteraeota bacterium]
MAAVDELAHTAGLVAALCDRLDDPVLVVSPQRRVLWLNAAARDLFGTPVDAVGRPLAEVAADYRIALLVTTAFDRQVEVGDELTDVLGARTVVARAIPIASEGHRHVAVVLRDQTRLRQLETVRRDFVANVSHELRTPVTAIHLLVETLQNGALGEPEAAARFVDRIGLEVAHLRQMVDELLELSLMEAGERPLRPAPVAVAELVHAADRLRPLAEERGVDLRFDVEEGTPPIVGDASRLALVVRNLVHNAIKFTPRGGTVTVRAARQDAGSVALEVADSGVGITADALPRIFERFYKADRSRQRDGDGAGLGLAIARHTVEAHGGRIDVASEAGHGTTFTVVLPAV